MMGMQIMAIREIANTHDDTERRSKVFSSLLTLNLLCTFAAVLALVFAIQFIPKLHEYHQIMYIGVAKVLFNSLLIEWFYKGIEDFKYITVRSLIVKTLYVISVFLFVKKAEDYQVYYLLTVLVFVFNALINIYYSRRFVKFSFRLIDIKPFLRSFFILGFYLLLTSMYTTFNTAYLGFVSGEIEVGYYTTATKLYSVILGVFSAFTGVMLPRMSSLVSEGNNSEFMRLSKKSIDVLFSFSMPLIAFVVSFAPQLVRVIAGPGYEGAIVPMRIVMPLMLIIGYEQILIVQVLTPLGKDRALFVNSIIGAFIGILLNILMVRSLGAIGSSIVWIVSELAVLVSAQLFVSRYIHFSFPIRILLKNLLLFIPGFLLLLFLSKSIHGLFLSILLGAFASVMYFLLVDFFILKNSVVVDAISRYYHVKPQNNDK